MKKIFPEASVANIVGCDNSADCAGPPSPAYPLVPVPARTDTYDPVAPAGVAEIVRAVVMRVVAEIKRARLPKIAPQRLQNLLDVKGLRR
jgi:hypothetical protein